VRPDLADKKEEIVTGNDDLLEADLSEGKLQQEIDLLTKEKKELFEQVLRKQADFDNYRKRMMRERLTLRDEVLGDFTKKLFPIMDNLERALESSEKDTERGLKEGIERIHRQFQDLLREEGIEEILCRGEAFDPHIHEAVMQVDAEDYAENTVVEELQKGYRLKDRILRCPKVTVAK
jgi:molecular chaperone GrpE